MFQVLGGNISCYKTLGKGYLSGMLSAPLLLITWEVMGAKHDKVKK
jgi:hypothetical protein